MERVLKYLLEHKTFLYCRLLQARDQVSPRNKDPLPVSPPGSFQWSNSHPPGAASAYWERHFWQWDCSVLSELCQTFTQSSCSVMIPLHTFPSDLRIMAVIKIDADCQLCNRVGLSLSLSLWCSKLLVKTAPAELTSLAWPDCSPQTLIQYYANKHYVAQGRITGKTSVLKLLINWQGWNRTKDWRATT